MGLGVIGLLAAVGQDERNGLIERTKAGIAAARRRGKGLGRPQKLSADEIAQARAILPDLTRGEIAKKLQVNVGTLRRALR